MLKAINHVSNQNANGSAGPLCGLNSVIHLHLYTGDKPTAGRVLSAQLNKGDFSMKTWKTQGNMMKTLHPHQMQFIECIEKVFKRSRLWSQPLTSAHFTEILRCTSTKQ